MKRSVFLLFILCLFVGVPAITAQNKAEKKQAKARAVKELIETKDYTINVRRAYPMSGRSVSLTSSYSLTVRGDSVYSRLPYYGRAYSLPYGGGEGLSFESQITGYELKYGKKEKAEISFQTRTREDNYMYRIEIFPNGSASVQVSSNNKQSIMFNGDLELDDKK